MNRKLIISLSTIAAIAMIVIGATTAYFSNTEKSEGNTFTAGAIDLMIDNTSYYNGKLNEETTWTYEHPIGLFFNFTDMKPGDWGEDTISVRVHNNDAWACMDFYLYNVDEIGDLTGPEIRDGDTTEGPGRGELQDYIYFVWWKDDGDNVLEVEEPVFQQKISLGQLNTFSVPLADYTGKGVLNPGPLVGDVDYYIGKAWCYGEMILNPVQQGQGNPTVNPGFTCSGAGLNNITQSDGVQGTLSFRAIQAKNNDKFVCESLCTDISFLYADGFKNVDNPTGWSTDDNMVNLGTDTWSLLSGTAKVKGYRPNTTPRLTHRGTRGLGVYGNENDEVDSLSRVERIEITFDSPVLVNAFQVRSLFANEVGGDEEGDVELWNGANLVQSYHLTGTQAGGDGILDTFGSNQAVDKIAFYVKSGQSYTSYSEFAVSKVRVCPVPTPVP